MRGRLILGVAAAACLALGAGFLAAADDEIVSGPQPGENCATPFNPRHVTGPNAGSSLCLV